MNSAATPAEPVATRGALAALSLSILLASLGTSIANVGLPALARSFGASFHDVQWIVLAYLAATTGLVVVAGRLGDLWGRRRLLALGLAIFAAASLLCGAAPSLAWLVAARALQGCGAALMMALALAFVAEIVTPDKTGSAMGLLGSMSAIGTALGPSLGGLLISGFGWRAIFLVQAPLGVLALLLVWRHLPAGASVPTGERPKFLAGAASLLKGRRLVAGLASSLLVSAVLMATLVVGPFYLTRSLGLEAALAGIAMSAGPIVAALAGLPAGRLVDRCGARVATLLGLGGVAAGCAALALLPTRLGIAGYLAPILVITAAYALFQAANNTAILADIVQNRRGVVSGLLNLSRNLGLIAGAYFLGAVFASGAGPGREIADVPPAVVAAGMQKTFAVAAALMSIALIVAAGRPKPILAAKMSMARRPNRFSRCKCSWADGPIGKISARISRARRPIGVGD
jgi:MFS family permease